MDAHHGAIHDPDLPPVIHPVPPSSLTTSSSLLHALAYSYQPPAVHRKQQVRSSPPPFYNPYPYPPQWRLDRIAEPDEIEFWRQRQDKWHQDVQGAPLYQVRSRVYGVVTAGIAKRQVEAKKEHENARLKAEPPPEPGTVPIYDGMRVEFATVDGTRGLPAKLLISTRRALERGMQGPKDKCLEGWPKDTLWVRVKWPAYPNHELSRSVFATIRAGSKRPRRPTTRLELVVALSALLTQYYSDVGELEPAVEFGHLALGPQEGRLSIYALRMVGIRLAPDGVFDMLLELEDDTKGRVCPSALTEQVTKHLIPFESRDQTPVLHHFVEGSSSSHRGQSGCPENHGRQAGESISSTHDGAIADSAASYE